MTNNTNKKKSAARKLLPAVSMLTVSAVMLSTATYAWFTMNKEVQVTGLQMSATASEGMEISLGAIGTNTSSLTPSITAPSKNDLSWKRKIAFTDYYNKIGKLMPASSVEGKSISYVDTNGVYAGGHAVEENTYVKVATKGESATFTLSNKYGGNTLATSDVVEGAGTDAGYYIDIPMWIRASNTSKMDVNCAVAITDGATNSETLMQAVRVAIIPIGGGTTSDDLAKTLEGSASWTNASTGANTLTASGNTSVYALDDSYYHNKVIPSNMTSYAVASLAAPQTVVEALTDNSATPAANTITNTIFTLDPATENDYSGEAFIVRVWLEGESTHCEDATANQDWGIDLYFTMVENTNP